MDSDHQALKNNQNPIPVSPKSLDSTPEKILNIPFGRRTLSGFVLKPVTFIFC
jgi:hypothetical protein